MLVTVEGANKGQCTLHEKCSVRQCNVRQSILHQRRTLFGAQNTPQSLIAAIYEPLLDKVLSLQVIIKTVFRCLLQKQDTAQTNMHGDQPLGSTGLWLSVIEDRVTTPPNGDNSVAVDTRFISRIPPPRESLGLILQLR